MLGISFTDRLRKTAAVFAISATAIAGVQVVSELRGSVPVAEAAAASNAPIVADALANGYIKTTTDATNAANTLSGRAWVVDQGTPATMSNGLTAVPEGTTVYMQWIDTDGSVSPVYSAQTTNKLSSADGSQVGPGAYAFDLRNGWTDANGKKHVYSATSGQWYRLYIAPYTNADGNQMTMLRQAGGFFPNSFVNSATGSNLGQFPLAGTNMQRTGIYMSENEATNYMFGAPDKWISDIQGPLSSPAVDLNAKNSVSGKVWLETGAGDYANSATGPNYNPPADKAVSQYRVVMSSLTQAGAKAYDAQVAKLPQAQQTAAAKALLTAHPEYISATVTGVTDANGAYTLRFPSGTLDTGHMFGQVLDPQGNVVQAYSSYTSPLFKAPNANLSWAPQTAPAQNLVANPMWYNVNFALVNPAQAELDITNFDATNNPAYPGAKALLNVTGSLSPLNNKIVWTDSTGKVVRTCDGLTSIDAANACTFDVPVNAANGAVYTATLYFADNKISADSFIVSTKKLTESHDPSYQTKEVVAGKPVTVKQTGDTAIPSGTTFAIDPTFPIPSGWTVEVDPTTGDVTVTSPADATAGYKIDVPVVVTYPDKSTDNVTASVTVDPPAGNTNHDPSYAGATANPGAPVTVEQTGDTSIPAGTTYAIDTNTVPEGWEASVDDRGVVTVTPPMTANPGDSATIGVTVTYPDTTVDNAPIKVTVTAPPQNSQHEPSYQPVETTPGVAVPILQSGDPLMPVGTQYTVDPSTVPAGWTATVDSNGALIVTPPADAAPETSASITITATYPDGSSDTAQAVVKVVAPKLADQNIPAFDGGSVLPGNSVTVSQTATLPAGTTYAIDTANLPNGWTATVDGDGKVTATAPADVPAGTVIGIPVLVTYSDGSTDTALAPITVIAPPAATDSYNPGYDLDHTAPGVSVSVPQTGDPTVQGHGTYSVDSNQVPADWTATVDETSGTLTVTPPKDAVPGTSVAIPVIVTYPDGSVDTANAVIAVSEPADATNHSPAYLATTVLPNKSKTVDQTGDTQLPAVTTFSIDNNQVPEGWTASVDTSTGAVTFEAPSDAQVGDSATIPVQVTYPDGSSEISNLVVTVVAPQAVSEHPGYEVATTPPGVKIVVEQTGDKDLPTGTEFELGNTPANWTVTIDSAGAVTATPASNATPGDIGIIPVVVKYPDGTSETVELVVTVGTATPTDAPTSAPTSSPDTSVPTSSPVTSAPTSSPDTSAPTSSPVTSAPTSSPDTSAPTSSPVTSAPTSSPDTSAPTSSPVTSAPTSTPATTPTPTPEMSQADQNNPGYQTGTGTPRGSVQIDQTGDNTMPDGTTYTTDSPNVKVDPKTGEVTVIIPEDASKDSVIAGTIKVTYPDGSSESVPVAVVVGQNTSTPPSSIDAADNTPSYKDTSADPNQTITIPQTGDTTMPDGTKYTTDSSDITVDPSTGVVTVKVPSDANPGDVIHAVVTVTYPDGSTEQVPVVVTVNHPATPPTDAYENNPGYNKGSGKPGDSVKVEQTGDSSMPAGTKYETASAYFTVDPVTGEVIAKIPANEKPGDAILGTVKVTYPDGSTEMVPVSVTVDYPTTTAGATDADQSTPAYPTEKGKPDSDVTLTQTGDTTMPDGTKYETNSPDVTVDPKTGEVTVRVPADAKPGDVITGTVTVSYPDGSTETVPVVVGVGNPDSDPTKQADWDNAGTVPGGTVEIPNTGGGVKPGTTVEVDQPEWTASIDDNGSIHVTAPSKATPGTKGTVTVKDKDGKVIDKIEVTVVPQENAILIPRDAVTNVGPVADDPASCTIEPHVIIPATTGVIYSINGKDVTAGEYTYNYGETVKVTARASEGYVLAAGSITEWTWTAPTKEECLNGKGTHGSIGRGLIPGIIIGGIIGSIIGGHGSTDGSTGSNGGTNGGNQGNQQGNNGGNQNGQQGNNGSQQGNNGGNQNGQQGNNGGNQNGQQTGPQKGMPADGQNNRGQNNGAASQPQKGKGMLASTGVQAFGAAMLAGLVAMILGIAFLMVRRRKDS